MGHQWTLVAAGCSRRLTGGDPGFRQQFIVGYRLMFHSLAIASTISEPSGIWIRDPTIVLQITQTVSLRYKMNPSTMSIAFAEQMVSNQSSQTLTDAMGWDDVDAAQSLLYKTRIHA